MELARLTLVAIVSKCLYYNLRWLSSLDLISNLEAHSIIALVAAKRSIVTNRGVKTVVAAYYHRVFFCWPDY